MNGGFEYISKTEVFGIPLVHINYKKAGIAKGIIAIGNIAIGIVAIGGISLGILSIGGLALGIIMSLGGVSISGLISFGGVAVAGLISFGGVAVSKLAAFGGYARADIATGGVSKGIVSVYSHSGTGKYLFNKSSDINEVMNTVKKIHPSLNKGILNTIEMLIRATK